MTIKQGRVKTIKAVLFDLDGTLLDTESLSDRAVLAAFGPSLPKNVREERAAVGHRLPWEVKRLILGLRGSEFAPIVVSYAQENWGVAKGVLSSPSEECNDESSSSSAAAAASSSLIPPPSVPEFWKSWEDHLNSYCEQIVACPGATELVQEFAKIGLPLAIATSSREEGVTKKRKNHDEIFRHIPVVVAGDDPAVKCGKPAPDIYLEAARRLGVRPAECLVFEDALSGAKAGKAAGCHVVAVPDPRFSSEEKKALFAPVADVILDDLWQFRGADWGLEVDMASVQTQCRN